MYRLLGSLRIFGQQKARPRDWADLKWIGFYEKIETKLANATLDA
ncbi:hypothetical protein AO382_2163 [Moraxella catarrhalis]|uniref:Uncharacterized protein n=1 Tax=Moraxella catarrhalis TaxID=480 RepID=A0A7Z0UWM1_MORCA|nr:hypothetical protein AO382_2163 [Moraxella catarrhalis]